MTNKHDSQSRKRQPKTMTMRSKTPRTLCEVMFDYMEKAGIDTEQPPTFPRPHRCLSCGEIIGWDVR